MCKGISGIINGRNIYVFEDTNSHTEILKRIGIADDKPVELQRHVKFEVWPCGALTSMNPADWKFVLDDDVKPDWFEESEWSDRCVDWCLKQIVSEWIKTGECKSSLDLRGTGITSLPEGLHVGGSLDLQGTGITALPEGLHVGDDLDLQGTGITSLPEGLHVGGYLDLRGTGITALPEGLHVGDYLDLQGMGITALPEGLHVGGSLYLRGTGITSLPEGLHVGGSLDLRGMGITSLPEGLHVGGSLDLRGTQVKKEDAEKICKRVIK